MTNSVKASIHGIDLVLFARRAAFCQLHNTLFVSDTHFGKDATFRRNGIPVPVGSSEQTLRTITDLLAETSAKRLVILGDLFHARSSLSPSIRSSVDTFFAQNASVQFTLVRGNHDKHLWTLPLEWPLEIVEPGARIGSILLSHEPTQLSDEADVAFCGHLHPAIRLGSASEAFGKLPCFWLSEGCLVFPAIGEFTGTHVIRASKNDRAWAIADHEIFELKQQRR